MDGKESEPTVTKRTWADAALIVFGGGTAAKLVELALREPLGVGWAHRVGLTLFLIIFIVYRPSWRGVRSPSA